MFNNLFSITTIVSLFCLFSCEPAEQVVQKEAFFSLTDYFEEQIELLEQQGFRLEKSVELGGKSEQMAIDQPDFKKELASFIANDINKPAWKDKYSVDSLLQDGRLIEIKYRSLDEGLQIKGISISFDKNGEVDLLSMDKISHSVLSDTEKSIHYISLQEYIIKSVETSKTGEEVVVEIKGRFLK